MSSAVSLGTRASDVTCCGDTLISLHSGEYLWYCLNFAPFALGIPEKRIPPHDRALVS